VELYLGAYKLKGSLSDFLYGLLDEVRISNVNRSSDWIQTTYNTIMYPSLFLDTEPQQNQNFTYLKITAENSGSETRIIENYNVLVNGTNSSFVSLQPYHYPDTDITLLVNVSVGGTKDNKIITDNGRSDYFPFTFP